MPDLLHMFNAFPMVFVPKWRRKTPTAWEQAVSLRRRTMAAMERRCRLAQGDCPIADKPIDFLYISFYYVPREA
jgi:hypothetical protein